MTHAEELTIRILVRRFPGLSFKASGPDDWQLAARADNGEPPNTSAADLEQRVAAAIRTPAPPGKARPR
jgi:hypothetical protein